MTPNQTTQLEALIARFGFRMSNLDAKRAGVRESVLVAAVAVVAVVYLVFA